MDEHTFISLYKSMVRPHVEGHYDLRKHFFTMRKVNIWNSLPNSVVHASTVNAFKARLDKFWSHQAVKFDFTAVLTGTGNRSEELKKL